MGSGEITLQAELEVCETGRLRGGTGGRRGWRGRWGRSQRGLGAVRGFGPCSAVLFPTSELPSGVFSTHWASVLGSPPPRLRTKGALCPRCPPPPGALQAEAFPLQAEAFPLPAARPGPSVSPPLGRGEACFSSLLRNRASETHSAAVKISGSVRAAAQRAPCSPRRQRPRGG